MADKYGEIRPCWHLPICGNRIGNVFPGFVLLPDLEWDGWFLAEWGHPRDDGKCNALLKFHQVKINHLGIIHYFGTPSKSPMNLRTLPLFFVCFFILFTFTLLHTIYIYIDIVALVMFTGTAQVCLDPSEASTSCCLLMDLNPPLMTWPGTGLLTSGASSNYQFGGFS